jgi:hypothetical protein
MNKRKKCICPECKQDYIRNKKTMLCGRCGCEKDSIRNKLEEEKYNERL